MASSTSSKSTYTFVFFVLSYIISLLLIFLLLQRSLKLYDVSKVGPLVSYLDNLEQNLILKNDVYPGLGTQTTVTTAWFMYRSFT